MVAERRSRLLPGLHFTLFDDEDLASIPVYLFSFLFCFFLSLNNFKINVLLTNNEINISHVCSDSSAAAISVVAIVARFSFRLIEWLKVGWMDGWMASRRPVPITMFSDGLTGRSRPPSASSDSCTLQFVTYRLSDTFQPRMSRRCGRLSGPNHLSCAGDFNQLN